MHNIIIAKSCFKYCLIIIVGVNRMDESFFAMLDQY